jgi:hypothetical protein
MTPWPTPRASRDVSAIGHCSTMVAGQQSGAAAKAVPPGVVCIGWARPQGAGRSPAQRTPILHRPPKLFPAPSNPRAGLARTAGFRLGRSGGGHSFGFTARSVRFLAVCRTCRANISTLQGSLHVSGCWFALLPQEDVAQTLHHPRTRQHLRSPRSTRVSGLLRAGLTLTPTGPPPATG